MSSTSQTLDEFIAERLTATIAAAHPGATTTIAPAATWTLCGSLAERGLAVSDSSGVAAKQIGPFRLALKGDGPDTVNAMIETVIPIAVSYAAADGSSSAAYYGAMADFG